MSEKKKLLDLMIPYLTKSRNEVIDKVLSYRTRHFTVVLEDLYRAQNAGAIARSCECFGIQDIYVIDKYHQGDTAWSISKGATKWLDTYVYRETENGIVNCIQDLRQKGYRIVATSPHQNQTYLSDLDLSHKTAFVFGAEKKGISKKVSDNVDAFVKIPIYGFSESYNVSVAVALVLQDIVKRMHQNTSINWRLNEKEIIEKKLEWVIKSVPSGEKIREYLIEKHSLNL